MAVSASSFLPGIHPGILPEILPGKAFSGTKRGTHPHSGPPRPGRRRKRRKRRKR